MKNVSVLLYLKRRKRYGIHTTNESRELMQPGEELHHYDDDVGSRIMEQVTRIAAVIQMFITPESSIITKGYFSISS